MDYKLFWTDEAVNNLEDILNYLLSEWSQKEVDNFKQKLSKQLDLILMYPKMFPSSVYKPGLRKAVLSKQTSVYYAIKGEGIYITFIFINRRDIGSIK